MFEVYIRRGLCLVSAVVIAWFIWSIADVNKNNDILHGGTVSAYNFFEVKL